MYNNEEYDLLSTKRSPYFVEYSDKIRTAFELAIKNGLFEEYDIDNFLVYNYLNLHTPIPIWSVEAACYINKKYSEIPFVYQSLWFCLDGVKLIRRQPSGKVFRTRVHFKSCYIKSDEKLKQFILATCKKLGLSERELSRLCGYKNSTIRFKNNSFPLVGLFKLAQFSNFDPWLLLEGYTLVGKTSSKGAIVIPNAKELVSLYIILIWLRTEGHLELASTHVEINQKDNIESLIKLRQFLMGVFGLNNVSRNFPKGVRGEDRMIISSSGLRQVLCLKFDIPLGYKTGCLKRMELEGFKQQEYQQFMAAFIQTEGCLSRGFTRGKKRKLPRFEFIVKDKCLSQDCAAVLRKLNFKPSERIRGEEFKIGLYDSKQVIDMMDQTKPHLFSQNKLNHLMELL